MPRPDSLQQYVQTQFALPVQDHQRLRRLCALSGEPARIVVARALRELEKTVNSACPEEVMRQVRTWRGSPPSVF